MGRNMKKKNKNKSLVSQTVYMLVIQSVLLAIVVVTYICVSYYTVLENMQANSKNLLQLYGKELENKLENADMLLERLIYKNNDYDMLQSEKETERYYASVAIKNFIQEQITYDQYVDGRQCKSGVDDCAEWIAQLCVQDVCMAGKISWYFHFC